MSEVISGRNRGRLRYRATRLRNNIRSHNRDAKSLGLVDIGILDHTIVAAGETTSLAERALL